MYHFQKTACYMLNTMKGYNLKYDDWSDWNWPKTQVKNNDWQWLWSAGVELGLFRYGHLYRGTIEAVRSLSALGDIVVITHRPRSAVRDTLDWLAYIRLPIAEIHIQSEKGALKSAIQPHCDLYVDDKPENILDYMQNTKGFPLLWGRPWNRHFKWPEPYYAEAINTWEEVVMLAKGIHGNR